MIAYQHQLKLQKRTITSLPQAKSRGSLAPITGVSALVTGLAIRACDG